MSAVYRVELGRTAEREFLRLDKSIRERIAPRLRALEANPHPPGSLKLAGEENAYRIRVGDWRIIYEIRDKLLLVLVVRIAHRREVYR